MIRTLFEAMLDFSVFLDVDEELRPIWRDILEHLAPYPTSDSPNGTVFVDWDGAPLPPKSDRQMLGCIQVVYPVLTLYSHCTHTVLTLYSHCTHTVLTLYSHCTHTVLTHCTHTVLTLYSHCTHTVLTLYSHCTHTVLTLYSHTVLTHTHCTHTVLTLYSHTHCTHTILTHCTHHSYTARILYSHYTHTHTHCTHTVLTHCTHTLYSHTHCTHTVLIHCTHTVLTHCTHTLYSHTHCTHTVLTHCTHTHTALTLYSYTALTLYSYTALTLYTHTDSIQIVYPAARVSSSSANRTEFETAKNLMEYVGLFNASSDADCIVFQISTRLNYNQTAMYPNFEWALGSTPRPGYQPIGNLFANGLTQAQVLIDGAMNRLCY
jgi:hypothetical protein